MKILLAACLVLLGCGGGATSGSGGTGGSGSSTGTGGASTTGAGGASTTGTGGGGGSASSVGHFTYGVGDQVFRIEAQPGAVAENLSTALAAFGSGTRDRWLVPSPNGAHLVLSTDRLSCSLGECLVIAPADLSSLTLVTPGGADVAVEGTPAVNSAGDRVIYASQEGPHQIDLWLTQRAGMSWGAATLLTGGSTYAYNNMPALAFDEARVVFDCGAEPYPESGGNDACEVKLDGSGFRALVGPKTLPDSKENFVQFPHDSLDGVLFQGSWPVAGDAPESVWLLPPSGAPTPIAKSFKNAVSPCGMRDGRFGLLWLAGPSNPDGFHELTLVAQNGTLISVLTPGVDVTDIGIGCSD
jgi:hypothetical protein